MAGGHTTEEPNSITYYSVVSHDIISIGFLLSSLYGIDITAIDMDNAYLNTPCAEKIRFVGSDERGEEIFVFFLFSMSNHIHFRCMWCRSIRRCIFQFWGKFTKWSFNSAS